MVKFLTDLERTKLKERHKKERDRRICDRIKAVLMHDKGWPYKEIAEALLLSDEAIRIHIHEFNLSRKLKPENGGSDGKLNISQSQKLENHLQANTYLYVKDIVAFVEKEFNIEYTVSGMTNWLKVHRFSYKKPSVVPGKANIDAQLTWISEYKDLKENLPADDTICFIDGVHPTHNTKPAFGWIRKGKRKEIRTNTGRQRINISGGIDINSRRVFSMEDLTLNAASTISFLKQIEKAYPSANQVHIFCDNARYYKNKEVGKFLNESKIVMHFLPPYSPNLNPIERLWKFLNENVLYNKYYEKFSDFKDAVMGFLQSLSKPLGDLLSNLCSRITDNFRAIGSEACT